MRINRKPKRLRLTGLVIGIFVLLVSGCVPKTKILVQVPAEISTKGIKKVAIGSFEIAMLDQAIQVERNGVWHTKKVELTPEQKDQVSKQIRAKVVNVLGATPYFSLVYTDEFAELENDTQLQKMISAEGYKSKQVDAVINGKIWIQMNKIDGSDVAKADMKYVQDGSDDGLELSVQKVLWWPYKSMRGNLTMEVKLTRLIPTEVVAIKVDTRTFSHRVGGAPGGLLGSVKSAMTSFTNSVKNQQSKIENSDAVFPSFGQLISDLSTSIATGFVRRIAVTEKWMGYPIATNGDVLGKLLVEAGAYEMAIDHLQQVTSGDNNPDDLYNLGLAFEAIAEYGLAKTMYSDAWERDKENLMYAQGLGRIEKLLRENAQIRRQLSEKNQ